MDRGLSEREVGTRVNKESRKVKSEELNISHTTGVHLARDKQANLRNDTLAYFDKMCLPSWIVIDSNTAMQWTSITGTYFCFARSMNN